MLPSPSCCPRRRAPPNRQHRTPGCQSSTAECTVAARETAIDDVQAADDEQAFGGGLDFKVRVALIERRAARMRARFANLPPRICVSFARSRVCQSPRFRGQRTPTLDPPPVYAASPPVPPSRSAPSAAAASCPIGLPVPPPWMGRAGRDRPPRPHASAPRWRRARGRASRREDLKSQPACASLRSSSRGPWCSRRMDAGR